MKEWWCKSLLACCHFTLGSAIVAPVPRNSRGYSGLSEWRFSAQVGVPDIPWPKFVSAQGWTSVTSAVAPGCPRLPRSRPKPQSSCPTRRSSTPNRPYISSRCGGTAASSGFWWFLRAVALLFMLGIGWHRCLVGSYHILTYINFFANIGAIHFFQCQQGTVVPACLISTPFCISRACYKMWCSNLMD